MKVILNNDVENLGEEGDICDVAPGYARNFLLPKGLVLEHNARNIAVLEERRADIDKRKEDKRKEAAGVKERIESEPMKISMTAGTNGKLFGSVTPATIQEQLAASGIEIERKRIDISEKSLKTVGNFKVRIRLYGDEEAVLTVSVEASNAREIEKEMAKEAEQAGVEASTADAETGDEAELDPEMIAMRAAAADAEESEAADEAADEAAADNEEVTEEVTEEGASDDEETPDESDA
ncbi:MAG: 50S ribosomal protein L9 [Spirochaeta sp.]|jgi:large subunit ribosomal protein L9|nr:50S ribosomal protein L9 [Spirochaeta sp.]